MRRSATIDTKALEPRRAGEIERLIEEAGLDGVADSPAKRAGADRFQYALTLCEGERERTIRFGEEEATERVHRLLEALWREAAEPPDMRRA